MRYWARYFGITLSFTAIQIQVGTCGFFGGIFEGLGPSFKSLSKHFLKALQGKRAGHLRVLIFFSTALGICGTLPNTAVFSKYRYHNTTSAHCPIPQYRMANTAHFDYLAYLCYYHLQINHTVDVQQDTYGSNFRTSYNFRIRYKKNNYSILKKYLYNSNVQSVYKSI